MAYDERLAERIRELLGNADATVSEHRMFGGLAFLIGGNMAVAASGQGGLMVHIPREETDVLASNPHVARFEMRGKPVDGWLRVAAEGVRTRRQLEPWVRRGAAYAASLPEKTKSSGRGRGRRRSS